jgi:hypothetical protein
VTSRWAAVVCIKNTTIIFYVLQRTRGHRKEGWKVTEGGRAAEIKENKKPGGGGGHPLVVSR